MLCHSEKQVAILAHDNDLSKKYTHNKQANQRSGFFVLLKPGYTVTFPYLCRHKKRAPTLQCAAVSPTILTSTHRLSYLGFTWKIKMYRSSVGMLQQDN